MPTTACLRAALRALFDLLLPPRCPFCGIEVRQVGACSGCYADLPKNDRACKLCARPLSSGSQRCAACLRRAPPFERVVAPLRYEFPVDAALKFIKFHARLHYVPAFNQLLFDAVETLPADIDAVLPMPMHWRRRAARGFNQADEFARPVARLLGIPVLAGVRRVRNTAFQSGLDSRSRRKNLAGAFQGRRPITLRHVLIVDDVMTTGQSCRQLAHELRRCGVQRVSVLVVARAG